jgi:hypothetical protein
MQRSKIALERADERNRIPFLAGAPIQNPLEIVGAKRKPFIQAEEDAIAHLVSSLNFAAHAAAAERKAGNCSLFALRKMPEPCLPAFGRDVNFELVPAEDRRFQSE